MISLVPYKDSAKKKSALLIRVPDKVSIFSLVD